MYPTQQDNIVAYAKGPVGPTGPISQADIDALLGGVAADGDTLAKLRALIALRAPLDGADLTNVTVPTQANGNDSTKAASTEFVQQELTNFGVGQQTLLDGKIGTGAIDTDGTMAGNSDSKIPSQKAVVTYTANLIAAADAMVFKGVVDCSANPNYPAGNRGWTYRVSVAGKIGGSSGLNVEAGDLLICLTDSTAAGNQATVGTAWTIVQTNIDGAVVGPASVTDATPAVFDGATGKLIKSITYAAFKTALALVKADVGLGSVDNTSDASKPVSTAQAAADATKVATVKVKKFTSSGTYTPSTGLLYAVIECVGPGGAGGGTTGAGTDIKAGGGGGAGGYSRVVVDAATIGANKPVTVGTGGAGATNAAGGAGSGVTSVGTLCVANPGAGGALNNGSSAFGSPGAGGAVWAGAGSNDVAVTGSAGTFGPLYSTPANGPTLVSSGNGGGSFFGGGAAGTGGGGGSALAGNVATVPGAGGSGGVSYTVATNTAGGAGADGLVIITEYLNQ